MKKENDKESRVPQAEESRLYKRSGQNEIASTWHSVYSHLKS